MLEQYIFSGSLPENASIYVTRAADKELFEGLKAGKFCYVLNSRQSGKSSLRVRTMQRLREAEVACVSIDLSSDSVQDATPEQWYVGLIDYFIESLDLDVELSKWWNISQAGQSIKIQDKKHNLRQGLLYAGIAYAYLGLRENDINKNKNSETAKEYIEKAKENLNKIRFTQDNSFEALQISILKFRTEGFFHKQNNSNEKARISYQQAFDIFNNLKKRTSSEISPPFDRNITINFLSPENIEAFHREYLSLLPDKNSQIRTEVFKSLKEHFFDDLDDLLRNRKWKEG